VVQTADRTGLLVLNGPSPLLRSAQHFYCYLSLFAIKRGLTEGRLRKELESEIFEVSLDTAWGLVGLLSPPNIMWVYPPERHWPMMNSAVRFWAELEGEGARYSVGSPHGQQLWSLHTNLKYVLAHLGVPAEVLNRPLPPGGLPDLARSIPLDGC